MVVVVSNVGSRVIPTLGRRWCDKPQLIWDVCLRERLTVRRCALGACGRSPKEIYGSSRRRVSHGTFFRFQALMYPTNLPPGDCSLETSDAPEHLPPPECCCRSTPTNLQSDAGWGPDRSTSRATRTRAGQVTFLLRCTRRLLPH